MKKNSFVEGATIASLAIILTKVIGVIYVIPFHSIISDSGGALYGYAYNIYNIFLIISTSGIPLAISKITSEYNTLHQDKEKRYLFKMSTNVIRIFSLISFLICFIFAPQLAHIILGNVEGVNSIADVAFVIRCVSFALLIVPTLSITRGYLQGHNYITPSALSQVVEQVFRVAVIIFGSYAAIKLFHSSETQAVGVAIFGACVGAVFSYLYLKFTSRKMKTKVQKNEVTKEEKKEIIKKFISYVIPFILISIAGTVYSTTDMILIIRGLNGIGMNGADIETISGIFTTWGDKLVSIVTAFGTGIIVSLIPSLVSAYVKKDSETVNKTFNKTLQMLFFIILPVSLFASLYAKEIWKIFYGESTFGPIIMKLQFLVAFLHTAYIITSTSLQGLNKKKIVYISILLGLGLNAALDIPLIYLCNYIGIYPYYGSIFATLIGYTMSFTYVLYALHKSENLNYSETFKELPIVLVKIALSIGIAICFKPLFKHFDGRIMTLIILGITGIVYLGIYYLLSRKTFNNLFGNNFLKKMFRGKRGNNEDM